MRKLKFFEAIKNMNTMKYWAISGIVTFIIVGFTLVGIDLTALYIVVWFYSLIIGLFSVSKLVLSRSILRKEVTGGHTPDDLLIQERGRR